MPNLDPSSSGNTVIATGRLGVNSAGDEQVDRGQRGRHAEWSVELAAAGDGVQVAAGDDRVRQGQARGVPPRPDDAVAVGLRDPVRAFGRVR